MTVMGSSRISRSGPNMSAIRLVVSVRAVPVIDRNKERGEINYKVFRRYAFCFARSRVSSIPPIDLKLGRLLTLLSEKVYLKFQQNSYACSIDINQKPIKLQIKCTSFSSLLTSVNIYHLIKTALVSFSRGMNVLSFPFYFISLPSLSMKTLTRKQKSSIQFTLHHI
jgi:hypothetical protein